MTTFGAYLAKYKVQLTKRFKVSFQWIKPTPLNCLRKMKDVIVNTSQPVSSRARNHLHNHLQTSEYNIDRQ